MWIFTNTGFYTVVENQDNKNTVILRSRVKKDMVDFRAKYLPDTCPKITFHLTYDYPYRLIIPKTMYADAMAKAILDIDYRKFKESVNQYQGAERFSFMNKLWSMLIGLEKDKSRINHYYDRGAAFMTTDYRTQHSDDIPDWYAEYGNLRNRYRGDERKLLPRNSVVHSDD